MLVSIGGPRVSSVLSHQSPVRISLAHFEAGGKAQQAEWSGDLYELTKYCPWTLQQVKQPFLLALNPHCD
jgi:hypothetical protein